MCSAQTTLFRVQKFCEVGGQTVNVQGLNSTTHVQRSFPRCTVEVFLTGTTTHPSNIYSDNLSTPTPLANPFTANTDGSFGFYAATTACYDIVTSGGNTGDQFPAPFTYTNICSGGTGGGGPGITPGTPYQIPRYDPTGANIQDSTGSDNPANGPTRWPSGLTVVNNAAYRQFNNSPAGTAVNLSVCIDTSVSSTQQVKTCTAGSSNAIGIADNGVGTSGNVQVAMIGFHAAVFDGQTTINDYFGPSATVDGQFTDLGASKPNNVEIMGHVTSLNSGAGTLATVDLFTGDTVAPGASGGSGTVSNSGCANANAYYATTGTTVSADCSFTDDGAGNPTAVSLGLTGVNAGFLFQKQGTAPTLSATNSVYVHPPASVASTIGLVWPGTLPVTGNCVEWLAVGSERQFGDSGSPCGSGGSGSVTSVSQVSPNGVLSQSGGPITTSGTFTWAWSGTSGGVLYFSSASQVASSAALTANLPVFGGGAGAAPFSGTRSGNTTEVATVTGATTSGHCGQWDVSGNITDSGSACGGGASVPCPDGLAGTCASYTNDTVTGTATNLPVVFKNYTIDEQQVMKTTSADYQKGWATGFIGICVSGCGTAGNAIVKIAGQAGCAFESGNAPDLAGFVEIGSTGKCFYNGGAGVNENPEVHHFFGKANATGAAGSTTVINLINGEAATASTSGNITNLTPAPVSLAAMTPGSSFFTPSPIYLTTFLTATAGNTSAPITAAVPATATIGANRYYNGTSSGYFDVYGSQNGTSLPRLQVNTAGNQTALGGGSLRVSCEATACVDAVGNGSASAKNASIISAPSVLTGINGSVTFGDNAADGFYWTINGNTTLTASAASIDPGHTFRWTICQDGTGGWTLTWPTGYQNPPTMTTAANSCETAAFWWRDTTHASCIAAAPNPCSNLVFPTLGTTTNCANGSAPATCGSAASGAVAVPTGTNPTLTINTTAVTANSRIFLGIDESLTISATTCNTTLSTLVQPVVTARTAGTSFTIQIGAVIATNPACVSYLIVN